MAVHLRAPKIHDVWEIPVTYCGRGLDEYVGRAGLNARYINGQHEITVTKRLADADCQKCLRAYAAEHEMEDA